MWIRFSPALALVSLLLGNQAYAAEVPVQYDPPAPEAATAPVELSPELQALRDKVRSVLGMYRPRRLNTRDHSNWEVMHAIIAYGVDTQISRGGLGSPDVNAVTWMCVNGV